MRLVFFVKTEILAPQATAWLKSGMSDGVMPLRQQADASNMCVSWRLSLGSRGTGVAIDGAARPDLKGRRAEALVDDQRVHNYCWGAGIPCDGSTRSGEIDSFHFSCQLYQ